MSAHLDEGVETPYIIPDKKTTVELNSLGFNENNKGTISYDSTLDCWVVWDGSVWVKSDQGGGTELIDEGSGLGLVIKGRNPLNYGNIGLNAVDLGYNNSKSTTKGATGSYSSNGGGRNNETSGYAASNSGGFGNEISGYAASNAGGVSNEIIGEYSSNGGGINNKTSGYATSNSGGFGNEIIGSYSSNGGGLNNKTSGWYSFNGGGQNNYNKSYSESTLGSYGTDYTATSATEISPTDRALNLGMGTSSARKDLLTVLKNGKTGIGFNNFETTENPELLQINGGIRLNGGIAQFISEITTAPTSSTDTGIKGEVRFVFDTLGGVVWVRYECIETNTWVKSSATTIF